MEFEKCVKNSDVPRNPDGSWDRTKIPADAVILEDRDFVFAELLASIYSELKKANNKNK